MKKIIVLATGISILLSGCGAGLFTTATSTPTITFTPRPPTETATLTNTPTITPTFTITPSPTPTWVHQGPKAVVVPIILFHHVSVSPINSQYYVPPEKFDEELKLLRDWQYTTITIEMLLKAIKEGTNLPPRPLIISFDDGNLDNYTNAFPIMQKYGFTGVLYIVGNYMGADNYLNADQIKEMAAAGWEVGSHSMRHLDLTLLDPEVQRYEVVESKKFLEKALGMPIKTIAYPFGTSDSAVIDYAHFAGYVAGMSLGFTDDQGTSNLFTLQRRDIKGTYTVKQFALFLPWQGDSIYLPTDTPTPTPTPTRTRIPTYTQYPTSTTSP